MGWVCGTELRLWSLTTNASISKAPGKKMEAKLRDRAARGALWEPAEHPGDTWLKQKDQKLELRVGSMVLSQNQEILGQ